MEGLHALSCRFCSERGGGGLCRFFVRIWEESGQTVGARLRTFRNGHFGKMEALGLMSIVIGLTCCVALIICLWLAKAYYLFAYFVVLPLLQLTIFRSHSVPQSTMAATGGAFLIAAPIALLRRRLRLRAERANL